MGVEDFTEEAVMFKVEDITEEADMFKVRDIMVGNLLSQDKDITLVEVFLKEIIWLDSNLIIWANNNNLRECLPKVIRYCHHKVISFSLVWHLEVISNHLWVTSNQQWAISSQLWAIINQLWHQLTIKLHPEVIMEEAICLMPAMVVLSLGDMVVVIMKEEWKNKNINMREDS